MFFDNKYFAYNLQDMTLSRYVLLLALSVGATNNGVSINDNNFITINNITGDNNTNVI